MQSVKHKFVIATPGDAFKKSQIKTIYNKYIIKTTEKI